MQTSIYSFLGDWLEPETIFSRDIRTVPRYSSLRLHGDLSEAGITTKFCGRFRKVMDTEAIDLKMGDRKIPCRPQGEKSSGRYSSTKFILHADSVISLCLSSVVSLFRQ